MQLTYTSDQRPVDLTHCTVRIILRARAAFTHSYSVLCSLFVLAALLPCLDMAKRQVTSVFPHRSPCLLHESSHSKCCAFSRDFRSCIWIWWTEPLKKCFCNLSLRLKAYPCSNFKTEKNVHGSSILSQMTKRNSSKKLLVSWLPSPEISHPQVVLALELQEERVHSRLLYLYICSLRTLCLLKFSVAALLCRSDCWLGWKVCSSHTRKQVHGACIAVCTCTFGLHPHIRCACNTDAALDRPIVDPRSCNSLVYYVQ